MRSGFFQNISCKLTHKHNTWIEINVTCSVSIQTETVWLIRQIPLKILQRESN